MLFSKNINRNDFYRFLLTSVIIHALLCFVFLNFGFKRRLLSFFKTCTQSSQASPHLLTAQKNTRPARLVAQKSNFGWVLFDEPPAAKEATKPQEIPTTLEGSIGGAKSALAGEKDEPKSTEQKQEQPSQKASQQTPHVKQEAIKQPEKQITPAKTDSKTGASVQERIDHIKAVQEKLTSFKEGPENAMTHAQTDGELAETAEPAGTGTTLVRGAADHTGKTPKRNIIALTKGFVEKLHGEDGTDLVDRNGDPTKRPSLEELKYLMYESKINWCLQSTWKQNFYHRPMKNYPEGEAVVEFTLDRDGKLIAYKLLQSTGNKELDDMIEKNMKFASPFPPLPKHFQISTYTTGRIISVRLDKLKF